MNVGGDGKHPHRAIAADSYLAATAIECGVIHDIERAGQRDRAVAGESDSPPSGHSSQQGRLRVGHHDAPRKDLQPRRGTGHRAVEIADGHAVSSRLRELDVRQAQNRAGSAINRIRAIEDPLIKQGWRPSGLNLEVSRAATRNRQTRRGSDDDWHVGRGARHNRAGDIGGSVSPGHQKVSPDEQMPNPVSRQRIHRSRSTTRPPADARAQVGPGTAVPFGDVVRRHPARRGKEASRVENGSAHCQRVDVRV